MKNTPYLLLVISIFISLPACAQEPLINVTSSNGYVTPSPFLLDDYPTPTPTPILTPTIRPILYAQSPDGRFTASYYGDVNFIITFVKEDGSNESQIIIIKYKVLKISFFPDNRILYVVDAFRGGVQYDLYSIFSNLPTPTNTPTNTPTRTPTPTYEPYPTPQPDFFLYPYDERFAVEYLFQLPNADMVTAPRYPTTLLGGINNDIIGIVNDYPILFIEDLYNKYDVIIWYSKEGSQIVANAWGGRKLFSLMPAGNNSFYVIMSQGLDYYVYKITGPFQPATSVAGWGMHP